MYQNDEETTIVWWPKRFPNVQQVQQDGRRLFRTIQKRDRAKTTNPTRQTYDELDAAYAYFNKELFAPLRFAVSMAPSQQKPKNAPNVCYESSAGTSSTCQPAATISQ
jgi:hypothetical protein